MQKENWKPITNADGYLISNIGRVKSLKQNKERILKTTTSRQCRYHRVEIKSNDGRSVKHCIHHLVAYNFIGPRPEGLFVCHLNGNLTDNRVENLAYQTHQQNISDKRRHGTQYQGEDTVIAKLTNTQVKDIYLSEISNRKLAKIYGVVPGAIANIKSRTVWKSVTEEIKHLKPFRKGNYKITDDDVINIYKDQDYYKLVMEKYKISEATYRKIKSKGSRKSVTQNL